MGGAFLEDTRFMYTDLAITKLMSIERKQRDFERQRFNCPFPFVRCKRYGVNDMIDRFQNCIDDLDSPDNAIVWLDYTSSDRGTQLAEVRELSGQLGPYDIVRVTLNASLTSIDDIEIPETEVAPAEVADQEILSDDEQTRRGRCERLTHQLGEFAPVFGPQDMTNQRLPMVLSQAVHRAMRRGVGENLTVQPIANFAYADQQQMVTVTAAYWPTEELSQCLVRSGMVLEDGRPSWPFFTGTPSEVVRIAVPILSVRERIEIDRFLGSNAPTAVDNGPERGRQAGEEALEAPQVLPEPADANEGEQPADAALGEDGLGNANDEQNIEQEAEYTINDLFPASDLEQYRRFQRYYPVYARVAV